MFWSLDKVFDENDDNHSVFESMVKPKIDKSLLGFDTLICAYG